MAMNLVGVGAAAAIFAWHLVMANMFAVDGSYWELVWMQQILQTEILLGDQIPKICWLNSLYSNSTEANSTK
jgi:hypothetical protein